MHGFTGQLVGWLFVCWGLDRGTGMRRMMSLFYGMDI